LGPVLREEGKQRMQHAELKQGKMAERGACKKQIRNEAPASTQH